MKKDKKEFNPEFKNFREVVNYATNKYKTNTAYIYKENLDENPTKYIEKSFEQTGKDIKAFSTSLLNSNFDSNKVALIGENRYEWIISYFAVTCSGKVIAPMDKSLPEEEIRSLIKRSEVEVAIFDKKYIEVFKKIKHELFSKLKTLICMDYIDDPDVICFSKLLQYGRILVTKGDTKFDQVKIDENAMSIMLFTSGTTDKAKIVMLSQKNICSNIYAYQNHFIMLPSDTLLSFLPIHHTFESSITIIYGFYCGARVAFCDGIRHIADNLKEYEVSIFVAVPLLLETMYKKIQNGIASQGKTKLINKLIKFSNGLQKHHIDIRRKLFKSILDKFGGKLRIILYGAASLDKDTIIGFKNFGIDSIQGYGLTETSPVLVAESKTSIVQALQDILLTM